MEQQTVERPATDDPGEQTVSLVDYALLIALLAMIAVIAIGTLGA